MDTSKTAQSYYDKAEKKLDSWWGSSTSKLEDAAELFDKAANSYKIVKDWDNAGESFTRAANCLLKDSPWEAANRLTSAGNCFKKSSPSKAINAFKEASQICLGEGKFLQAAQLLKDIAEIYEQEFMINESIDCYKEAAEIYGNESSSSNSSTCLIKAAAHMSTKVINRYSEAITLYEKIVDRSINNNLLKWQTKEYLFRAALCGFALGDVVGSARALDYYDEKDAGFSSSREGKFLRQILTAVESYDAEGFTNAVVEFDSITPLDTWKTEILLVIKKTIPTNENTEDEENPDLT